MVQLVVLRNQAVSSIVICITYIDHAKTIGWSRWSSGTPTRGIHQLQQGIVIGSSSCFPNRCCHKNTNHLQSIASENMHVATVQMTSHNGPSYSFNDIVTCRSTVQRTWYNRKGSIKSIQATVIFLLNYHINTFSISPKNEKKPGYATGLGCEQIVVKEPKHPTQNLTTKGGVTKAFINPSGSLNKIPMGQTYSILYCKCNIDFGVYTWTLMWITSVREHIEISRNNHTLRKKRLATNSMHIVFI